MQDLAEGLNPFSVTLRIALSVLCGGVLGLERGRANQSAGMRTYILVCLGATVVMLTGQYMFEKFSTGDPARLGAQVISGIGFLGAGSIIVEGKTKVRGLTTAAGWPSALGSMWAECWPPPWCMWSSPNLRPFLTISPTTT